MDCSVKGYQNSGLAQAAILVSGLGLLGVAGFKLHQLLKTTFAPGRPVLLKTALKNPIVLAAGGAGTVITAGGITAKFLKTTPPTKTDKEKLQDLGLKFSGPVVVDLNKDAEAFKLLKEAAATALKNGKIAIVLGTDSPEKKEFIAHLKSDANGGLEMPEEKVLTEVKVTDLKEVQKGAVVFNFAGGDPVVAIKTMVGDKTDKKLLENFAVQPVTVTAKTL